MQVVFPPGGLAFRSRPSWDACAKARPASRGDRDDLLGSTVVVPCGDVVEVFVFSSWARCMNTGLYLPLKSQDGKKVLLASVEEVKKSAEPPPKQPLLPA